MQLQVLIPEVFSANKEVKTVDARIGVGSLIIRYMEGKCHHGTLEMIQENPYIYIYIYIYIVFSRIRPFYG